MIENRRCSETAAKIDHAQCRPAAAFAQSDVVARDVAMSVYRIALTSGAQGINSLAVAMRTLVLVSGEKSRGTPAA